MRRVDLFCASPASTAICSSMDQKSMVRRGTRPVIGRHGHRLGSDHWKPPIPCTSQLPFDPKRYYYQMNPRSSFTTTATTSASARTNKQSEQKAEKSPSAGLSDQTSNIPASSRFLLLSDKPFEVLSDSDRVKKLHQLSNGSQSPSLKSPASLSRPRHQVVELRVSIHCKGCEGKIRKHISRMEGVTSFSIDLESKKVTVIGDVTPLGVLTSISRVKNAQFWPSPTSSSSSSSSPRTSRLSSSHQQP
ncbi:hypothetical protein NMG60_11033950 [Bertholletia excelsa]